MLFSAERMMPCNIAVLNVAFQAGVSYKQPFCKWGFLFYLLRAIFGWVVTKEGNEFHD